jgi:hypothetical protein
MKIWFNSDLNLWLQVHKFLVELQTPFHELSRSLGANRSPRSKFHSNLKITRRNSSKFYWNSNHKASLIFSFKIQFESEEASIAKVVPLPSKPYFISNLSSLRRLFLNRLTFERFYNFWNHLNRFKPVWISGLTLPCHTVVGPTYQPPIPLFGCTTCCLRSPRPGCCRPPAACRSGRGPLPTFCHMALHKDPPPAPRCCTPLLNPPVAVGLGFPLHAPFRL